MTQLREPKGIIGSFVKFEKWMMYGNNMYYLVGVIGLIYILIEALAMGTNVLVDENGNVKDGYTNFILGVDVSKTMYLAVVEFLFITMFAVTVSRSKADGWQVRDVLPIGTALLVMGCITMLVASVYLVERGYVTIGGEDGRWLSSIIDKRVAGRDYTTFVVICLSFVVAIVRSFFETIPAETPDYNEKSKEKPKKDEKSSSKEKSKDDSKKKDEKEEVEDEDEKDDDEVKSIIDDDWWDSPTMKTMEKLFQRVTSHDNPRPSLQIKKMEGKDEKIFEDALTFIADEGELRDGKISRENEEVAARIIAETWGVLESKETIRAHKDVAQRFVK